MPHVVDIPRRDLCSLSIIVITEANLPGHSSCHADALNGSSKNKLEVSDGLVKRILGLVPPLRSIGLVSRSVSFDLLDYIDCRVKHLLPVPIHTV